MKIGEVQFRLFLCGEKAAVEKELWKELDKLKYDAVNDNLITSRVEALLDCLLGFHCNATALQVKVEISGTDTIPVTRSVLVQVLPLWGYCSSDVIVPAEETKDLVAA